jgi:hypothetical protein
MLIHVRPNHRKRHAFFLLAVLVVAAFAFGRHARMATISTVTILNPSSGSVFQAPAEISIDVEATDSDGVAKVDFYQGSTRIGTDDTFPYSFTWTGMPACTYVLTATATNTLGTTTTSAPVTVKIAGGIGEPTPPNFKVAFIGNQGLGPLSEAALNLVVNEGAQALVISGGLDYANDPAAWEAQLNNTVGVNFPVFVVAGDAEEQSWHGPAGYQKLIEDRFNRIGIPWCGSCGVQQSFHYKGLFFVLSTPGLNPSIDPGNNDTYIREQLEADHSVWSISSWHKNMHLMQGGDKGDETGWEVYEESRAGGAIIATAHNDSYFRTHLLSSITNQTVASTADTMTLTQGDSFVVVSGLGGNSRGEQQVTGPWVAKNYASLCLPDDQICQPNAVEGALFGVFNVNGQQNKANFYFKNVNGQVIDTFTVVSQVDMPTIDSITPSVVQSGGSGATLVVNGSGFIHESKVLINGATRPTGYLSSTLLLVQLTAADIESTGVIPIKVVNAVTGGGISNQVSLTVDMSLGYEGDVAPRPNGSNNGTVTIADWVQVGRFVAGLDIPSCGSEFQRADVAPRNTLGDGRITISDWVQAGRYVAGLDPVTPAGGPVCPADAAATGH